MDDFPVAGESYELNLPKGHLSWSQIEKFLRCPEQYRLSYMGDIPIKEVYTSALAEGQAMHSTMEWLGKRKVATGKIPGEKVALSTHHGFWKKEEKKVEDWLGSDTSHIIRERSRHFIARFYEGQAKMLNPTTIKKKAAVEVPFKIKLAGVSVEGITDLVERRTVVDYKVQKGVRYLRPAKSFQLGLNAIAHKKSKVAYVVFDKDSLKVRQLSASINLEEMEYHLTKLVANVAMSISLSVFPPCNPISNPLCDERWCEFYGECFGRAEGI